MGGTCFLPGTTSARKTRLEDRNHDKIETRFSWRTIAAAFQSWLERAAGYHRETWALRVETDVVSSDRLVERRKALTENGFVALMAFARMMAAKKAPGALSTEELEEMESGC